MRDSVITDYFNVLKQEPAFETKPFDLNTSLECTSTVIKSEPQSYIKEEIDIPDDISNTDSDCDSLSTKPRTDLVNRTCSVVINRLSDSDLQKYLKNENQSEEIMEGADSFSSLNKDNVENSVTKNQKTEIIKNNGKRNLRNRKRSGKSDSGITKSYTSLSEEDIENFDTNSEQKEIIEDDGGEKIENRRKNDLEVIEFCTSPDKENKQTSHMDNKQKEIIKNNGEKKVRNREKIGITKFFTSLNKETNPLLENSTFENADTNNKQNKIIESNDKKDAKIHSRYSVKDGPSSTEFYRSLCPKCKKTYKTRTSMVECCDCKVRLMYECKKCRKQLGSHNGMASHVKGACIDQGYYYECFKCGFRSPLRNYVFMHLRRVHPNSFFPERIIRIASKEIHADVAPKIDGCSKCGEKFAVLHKLMKHVQLCNGSKNSKEGLSDYAVAKDMILRYCSNCDETIKDVGTDKKLCNKCQIVLAFKCSVCQKLYSSCGGIINHIVKNHIEKELRCFKCDYKTVSMTCLTSHYKRMHNPKVYECTKCRTTWKSREHLARHLTKCGVNPHLHCEHCSYKTFVRQCLRKHILKIHSREDKSVVCSKCHRVCKNEIVLNTHLKTTCGKEADLQCEHCSFKTKFKRSIIRHMLRHHSAGSKYECCKCKRQFENNTRLKTHLLVCWIERSLQCKMCSYKTYKKQYLRCHIRNKHRNDNGITP